MRKVIDIEGVIGSRQSKKDPQYNNQEKKIVEKTHIDLQDAAQKGKDWSSTNTANNNGMNSGDPEELAVPAVSLN